jgi:hypothetical protein
MSFAGMPTPPVKGSKSPERHVWTQTSLSSREFGALDAKRSRARAKSRPMDASEIEWHHRQTLAAGQVAEFKVWAELIRQSGGGLHVFLPLRDVGIDAVLHRLVDGEYLPLQVKGRMSLTGSGQVHITVSATSLIADDATIVATLVDGPSLGPLVLVVSEAEFRRLAVHNEVGGREYLTAAFQMHPGGDSRWAPYLVPRERLAARFGATAQSLEPQAIAGIDRGVEGFIGEAEVIRRLAETEGLALFRPFPDLETVEVLVRQSSTGRFAGLQVKTSGFDSSHLEERVYLRRSSFRPAVSTYICVLGWDRDASRFADSCLLIPSLDIAGLTRVESEWIVLELEPGSAFHRRLDQYRTSLASLGATVVAMV